jgi:hypothetical protein
MTDQTPRKHLPIRWLTIGEWVGVAALCIAALGYWDTHRERVAADREHQAEQAAQALKDTFLMTGAVVGRGERLQMTSVHPEQVIQTQTVWFPKAVRADSVETTGNPRLEAGWIDSGLRAAADRKRRHGRVPVAVETVYIEDGQTKTDRAVYELGYSLHPRFLQGDRVDLEGLSLSRRGVTGDLQAALDKVWSARTGGGQAQTPP